MVFFLFFGVAGEGWWCWGGRGVRGGEGVADESCKGRWVGMLKFKIGNGKRCVYVGCGSLPSSSGGKRLDSEQRWIFAAADRWVPATTAVFCKKKNKPLDIVAWLSRFT